LDRLVAPNAANWARRFSRLGPFDVRPDRPFWALYPHCPIFATGAFDALRALDLLRAITGRVAAFALTARAAKTAVLGRGRGRHQGARHQQGDQKVTHHNTPSPTLRVVDLGLRLVE